MVKGKTAANRSWTNPRFGDGVTVQRATKILVGFQDGDAQSRLSEPDGRGKPVWPRPNDDDIRSVHWHVAHFWRQSQAPSCPDLVR